MDDQVIGWIFIRLVGLVECLMEWKFSLFGAWYFCMRLDGLEDICTRIGGVSDPSEKYFLNPIENRIKLLPPAYQALDDGKIHFLIIILRKTL